MTDAINPAVFAVCLRDALEARGKAPLSLDVRRDAPALGYGPVIVTVTWIGDRAQDSLGMLEADAIRRGPEGIAALMTMGRRARREALAA